MTPIERTAALSLSGIFAARMLGLFMVIPLLSLYAGQLYGSTPLLMGLAVGVYGITQAVLQIPCGILSDRYNRKLIIAGGLIVFILGSMVAAQADSIFQMILGRALQGAGAIGGVTMALAADLTSESQHPKVMAIIGITIGASFALAMMMGPLLNNWFNVPSIFWISAGLGVAGLVILVFLVPPAPPHLVSTHPLSKKLLLLLTNPDLLRLNIGVFILHAIFTANFVVLPLLIKNAYIYIPTLLIVLLLTLPLLHLAQKKARLESLSFGAIFLLLMGELLLAFFGIINLVFSLIIFFTAFTFLEASLPSLVARIAPPQHKGATMGVYSCLQFLGIFAGGIAGGWIYGQYGIQNVFLFCAMLAAVWNVFFYLMRAK